MFFTLLTRFSVYAVQSCEEWFHGLELKAGTKECELQCAMAKNQMDSFECSSQCERFCRNNIAQKCELDKFWKMRLNSTAKPFANLSLQDRRIVEQPLSQMPKGFRPKNLKAIVKASGNGTILTGYSPAVSSDEYIILFPNAFTKPSQIPRIIAHELTHFLIENEWAPYFKRYKHAFGWKSANGKMKKRKGSFVEADGKSSPEEDFANNIEFYLFERSTLKVQSPKILKWIDKVLAKFLKKEKGCSDVK